MGWLKKKKKKKKDWLSSITWLGKKWISQGSLWKKDNGGSCTSNRDPTALPLILIVSPSLAAAGPAPPPCAWPQAPAPGGREQCEAPARAGPLRRPWPGAPAPASTPWSGMTCSNFPPFPHLLPTVSLRSELEISQAGDGEQSESDRPLLHRSSPAAAVPRRRQGHGRWTIDWLIELPAHATRSVPPWQFPSFPLSQESATRARRSSCCRPCAPRSSSGTRGSRTAGKWPTPTAAPSFPATSSRWTSSCGSTATLPCCPDSQSRPGAWGRAWSRSILIL